MKKTYSREYLIKTGSGLQDVDGLKNSEYFLAESKRYIDGEISLNELNKKIQEYYDNKPDADADQKEADIVSGRIAELLSDNSFTFSIGQLLAIHKYLFNGVLLHAGKFRTYNISKKEWVLGGDTVTYGDYRELKYALEYDLEQERNFSYKDLRPQEVVSHLSFFVANLWQNHIFGEGNTRTVAVFVIKYLRKLGFDVTNDTFEKNAWYFRNALARANYSDYSRNIFEDRSGLNQFFENLLYGKCHILSSKFLHITEIFMFDRNPREIQLLTLMRNNPQIKLEEVATKMDISLRTVKNIVKVLEFKKDIKRVGGKKLGYWKVKNKIASRQETQNL